MQDYNIENDVGSHQSVLVSRAQKYGIQDDDIITETPEERSLSMSYNLRS